MAAVALALMEVRAFPARNDGGGAGMSSGAGRREERRGVLQCSAVLRGVVGGRATPSTSTLYSTITYTNQEPAAAPLLLHS